MRRLRMWLLIAALIGLIGGPTQLVSASRATAAPLTPSGVDLRQNGPIEISGSLVEGGQVYLKIPVKNYGSTASPPVHTYTEGYTARGDLWRADGAQPTAVVIQPNQTVTFQVHHDLWVGHGGTWSTYGVYLWHDGASTYYGSLAANGFDQSVSFEVGGQPDIKQSSGIQISGTLVEGHKVYLTFSVKNYGSGPTPALHPYVEGRTALGDLWRADGAQPTARVLQPGETVVFQVEHDLWSGHSGTWSTSGIYLWNDDAGDYYGPLDGNGHDQTIGFTVSGGAQLRQDGAIKVSGSLVPGGQVYLDIPVKNVGGLASPPIHPYTEGYTGRDSLWRADGAEPTAVAIQPGERIVFRVQHDLWPGHEGTWDTYGVFLWNDDSHTYFGPLAGSGHSQSVEFDVQAENTFSMQLPFDHKAGENGLNQVSSFFDHEYPVGAGREAEAVAGTILKYNGERLKGTLWQCDLRSSCYSGHNGYDYTVAGPVRAAHAGYALGTRWNCRGDDQSIYVITLTDGRYRTVYLHVKNDAVWKDFHDNPRQVSAGTQIGTVGNTGAPYCSTGPHLHFATYYDANHDGQFSSSEWVDPYGFDPTKNDPWVEDKGGPTSNWLWGFSAPGRADISPGSGSDVTVIGAGSSIVIPSNAVSAPATLALMSVPIAGTRDTRQVGSQSRQVSLIADTVSIGTAFKLSGVYGDGGSVDEFSELASIQRQYAAEVVVYVDEETIGVYIWDEINSRWHLLPTDLDTNSDRVTAAADRPGTYSLRATPLNPAPRIFSVLPSRLPSGEPRTITVSGAGFLSDVEVQLGISALEVTRLSSTVLHVDVPTDLTPGTYDIIVRNPDGQTSSASSSLAIGDLVYLPVVISSGR